MEVEEYMNILDSWILAENRIVTYKLLSRLMRIRADLASEYMLKWHESHKNSHATYVICGSKPGRANTLSAPLDSDTAFNQRSSGIGHDPTIVDYSHVVRLVAEEDLEQVKAQFTDVVGCQIYSLEPAKLCDISLVTSCNLHIQEAMSGQSSKIADLSKTYGIIFNESVHELDQNPEMQEKPNRAVKPIMKEMPNMDVLGASHVEATTNHAPPTVDNKMNQQTKMAADIKGSPSVAALPPPIKRSASSSLASAFAKTQKPKPKVNVQGKKSGTAESSKTTTTKASTETKNKGLEKTAATAELEAMMMQEDDVPMPDTNEQMSRPAVHDNTDNEMLDTADWSASDTEMKENDAVPEIVPDSVVPPLPRRARKKVKKQVHTKDAKGYMVTREEWEWVSCDEEEMPAVTLARQSSVASNKSKPSSKKKMANGGAAGIASYFTKK